MEIIIKSNPKEIAGLLLEKERGQTMDIQNLSKKISFMLSDEVNRDNANGLQCLCQHFAVWYEDIKNGRIPDFSAPCQSCQNQEICHQKNYPWANMILPVLEEQGVAITLVRPEQ